MEGIQSMLIPVVSISTRSNVSSILSSIHKLMLHVPKATTTKIDLDFRIITWVWLKLSRNRTKKNPWQSHNKLNVIICKHWHCTSLPNHQLPTFLHFEGGALSSTCHRQLIPLTALAREEHTGVNHANATSTFSIQVVESVAFSQKTQAHSSFCSQDFFCFFLICNLAAGDRCIWVCTGCWEHCSIHTSTQEYRWQPRQKPWPSLRKASLLWRRNKKCNRLKPPILGAMAYRCSSFHKKWSSFSSLSSDKPRARTSSLPSSIISTNQIRWGILDFSNFKCFMPPLPRHVGVKTMKKRDNAWMIKHEKKRELHSSPSCKTATEHMNFGSILSDVRRCLKVLFLVENFKKDVIMTWRFTANSHSCGKWLILYLSHPSSFCIHKFPHRRCKS